MSSRLNTSRTDATPVTYIQQRRLSSSSSSIYSKPDSGSKGCLSCTSGILLILLGGWLFGVMNTFASHKRHFQGDVVLAIENVDKILETFVSSKRHAISMGLSGNINSNSNVNTNFDRDLIIELRLDYLYRGVIGTPGDPLKIGGSGGNKKSLSVQQTRNNNNNRLASSKGGQPSRIHEQWDLKWPPVDIAGNIPKEDGEERMPYTNLSVPRFWNPAPLQDLYNYRPEVNGQETIHLMLASYRDFQCRETITSAFNKADHPERLFIVAVDQISQGDIGCLDIDIPCSQNANQPICKYRSQIAIYKMDAKFATGPVTARHIGNRMYRGETYSMQLDAHCLFTRHWDTSIIDQWKSAKNEMAVLSTYLTDVQGSIDGSGETTRNTRPIMCNSDFEGEMPARYLRHLAQPELVADIKGSPQLSPFWAAGFSFARGHFTYRVPYDSYQPMVFQGEEIAIGIRGFTFGYDFYAPEKSVVFHEYAKKSDRRKKVPMFWENNSQDHLGEGGKSLKRATAIIGMARDLDPVSWDHTEAERYGIGTARALDDFYKIFLINPITRKAINLCLFVQSGDMHKDFSKHLKENKMGIDYSQLDSFDTLSRIEDIKRSKYPECIEQINRGIRGKNKEQLKYALGYAGRIGFLTENTADPALEERQKLYNEATALFQELHAEAV